MSAILGQMFFLFFFFFEQFPFNMSYSPKHSIPMLSEAIFGHWLEGRHEVSLYIQAAICFFPMKVQNHRQPCTRQYSSGLWHKPKNFCG